MRLFVILALIFVYAPFPGIAAAENAANTDAQDVKDTDHSHYPHHPMGSHDGEGQQEDSPGARAPAEAAGPHTGRAGGFLEEILQHESSGTSTQPDSLQQPMIMLNTRGPWVFMFHDQIFLNAEQESGPSGGGKVFSTNWFMPMLQRPLGPGQLTLRTMLSLEPGTVTGRLYPELFQQGETAFGKAIANGQHPHNLFMEVAALYDWKFGEQALLSLYAAPVGDPAMGPPAYPHRASASEDPIAPLGHHLQDSTHIVNNVVTTGVAYKSFRIEASGFHGREPDEFRWDIDTGRIDSWSTRLTVQPARNWSAQYSFAHLTGPEELQPKADVQRMTASVMYNRPFARGNWASTLLWGRNHELASGENFNGYLAESTLCFAGNECVWGRIENVDRTNELLLGSQALPPGFEERFLARVQAYTTGYDHEFHFIPGIATALGGQITWYGKPGFLTPEYGAHPVGAVLFVRLRAGGRGHSHHQQ